MSDAHHQIRAIGQMISGCFTKTPYKTWEAANREVKRQKASIGRDVYVYKCKTCGWRHLTSTKPRKPEPVTE